MEAQKKHLENRLHELESDDVIEAETGRSVNRRRIERPVKGRFWPAMQEQSVMFIRIKQEKNQEIEETEKEKDEEHRNFTVFISQLQVKLEKLEQIAKGAGANHAEIALAKCSCQFRAERCPSCADILHL